MFAKIFESIYDGTLADHWQAMVTFQQMLILADANGKVDMTPAALQRRTGIPLEIITAGLVVLEQPDPQSRSKAMEGRRIVRLDANRGWGWFLVNHAEYRKRISAEEKREADRVRIAERRTASQYVAPRSGESPTIADVAQAEAERAEAEAEEKSKALSVENASQDLPREPARPSTNGAREPQQPQISKAAQAAIALRAIGIKANPSNPHLLGLIDVGVDLPELVDVATEAIGKNITSIAWVATTLMGRRRDAANLATAGPRAGPQQESKLKQAIDAIKNRGKTDETRNAAVVPGGDRNRNDAPAGDGQTRSPAS